MLKRILLLSLVGAMGCKHGEDWEESHVKSDHFDGSFTSHHPFYDISDSYVFPSPEKNGLTTLVLNIYPVAGETSHFSQEVGYRFYFRQAEVNSENRTIDTIEETERIIDCTVKNNHAHESDQHAEGVDEMSCKLLGQNGQPAEWVIASKFNQIGESNHGRLFHGLRNDPFYFNATFFGAATKMGVLAPVMPDPVAPGSPEFPDYYLTLSTKHDLMRELNTLSIVLEVDLKSVFGSQASTMAMVATSYFQRVNEAGGKERLQIDRVGRPEATNVALFTKDLSTDIRNIHIRQLPFKTSDRSKIYGVIRGNIDYFRSVISQEAPSEQESKVRDHLAGILTEDFLLFDLSKPQAPIDLRQEDGEGDYFSIEEAVRMRQEHVYFGGRSLQFDAMDKAFSIVIADNKQFLRDALDEPDPMSMNFPYLAEPVRIIDEGIKRIVLGKHHALKSGTLMDEETAPTFEALIQNAPLLP